MDFEVHVVEVKRRKCAKSRSQGPRRGGWLRMGTEEEQAQKGVEKELRLKAVNRQQMILRAVDVEKLIEPDRAARREGGQSGHGPSIGGAPVLDAPPGERSNAAGSHAG